MANEERRKLSGCKCISNDDKDILYEALKQRRDNLILRYEERFLPTTKERMETLLDKTEKMMKTIKEIPVR